MGLETKSKTDKAMDGLLDELSFYRKKVTKALKYLGMVESASPSSKQVIQSLRSELEKRNE